MVKAYFGFSLDKTIGLGVSSQCPVQLRLFKKSWKILCGHLEFLVVLKASSREVEQVISHQGKKSLVSCIGQSGATFPDFVAVGFQDGDIHVLNGESDLDFAFNLDGHSAGVTALAFSSEGTTLFSGGADNKVIVWDLTSESALFKLKGHTNQLSFLSEVSGPEGEPMLLSCGKDGFLRLWDIRLQTTAQVCSTLHNEITGSLLIDNLEEGELVSLAFTNSNEIFLTKVTDFEGRLMKQCGKISRKEFSRILHAEFDAAEGLLFCLNENKGIEVFELLSRENQERKLKRAKKRAKEKKEINFDEEEFKADYGNKFRQVATFKLAQKPFHFLIHKNTAQGKTFFLFYAVNVVELRTIRVEKQGESERTENVHLEYAEKNDHFGHGQPVRSISVSSDDSMILSASGSDVRLWSTFEGFQCTRSFETGYITASLFLPGDRYALLGSKEGTLSLFDLAGNEKVQELEKAHEAAIWSMDCNANPPGFKGVTVVTGSADHSLKFWGLRLIKEGKQQRLEIHEVRKQFVSEDVMCVRFTLDGRFFAYSMLDHSIRVHYCDSTKLFLTMYGHKLPVVAFDITSDGVLLISGSADKSIKIWGLDFGDCHRSLLRHQDTVTAVRCVRDTHYFFTASKDATVKYFDGDTFELLLSFSNHFSAVWAIAVSSIGDFLVSGGNDRLLRIHRQTKDQFWAAEEEQKREEQTFVEDYAKEMLKRGETSGEEKLLPKGQETEEEEGSKLFKRKFENLKYGEQLIEALEETEKLRANYVAYETELKEWRKAKRLQRKSNDEEGPAPPTLPPWFDARNLPEYILNVLKTIKPSELESSLGFLHFSHIEILLFYIKYYVENNIGVELASRVLFYALQNYEHQIKGSSRLTLLLRSIQKHLRPSLHKAYDAISYNLVAMKIIKKELQESSEVL